jgi:nicotinamide phosphoribosyltransferase
MSMNSILEENFILATDSYKLHHFKELPSGVRFMLSSVVPRKGSENTDEIVAAGATLVAHTLANVTITQEMVDEAEIEVNGMGYEFNRDGWEIIVNELDGKLPLMVFGVVEGLVVTPNTPILTIVNTDDRFAWLVSYVETSVQRIMWKMTTVASVCRYLYKEIKQAMTLTGANMSMLEYKLHNFGDRGADAADAAIIAAIPHAMLFSGSDCTSANRYIKRLYNTKKSYLSSVDATEHSVMCAFSNAKTKDDFGAAVMSVERLEEAVARAKRGIGIPIQSVVIDTYDDERFVRAYLGTVLKERIIASGGVMVGRPDSGDPLTKPIDIIKMFHETFGLSEDTNEGYKVLHPSVRVIQGDGITQDSIPAIIKNLIHAGYSMDNLTFGMGGGLTHGPGRDEFSFSMKSTAIYTNASGWIDLLKEPKTDVGKKSLSGLVYCDRNIHGDIEMMVGDNVFLDNNIWKLYYDNGKVIYQPNFDEVRARARV